MESSSKQPFATFLLFLSAQSHLQLKTFNDQSMN